MFSMSPHVLGFPLPARLLSGSQLPGVWWHLVPLDTAGEMASMDEPPLMGASPPRPCLPRSEPGRGEAHTAGDTHTKVGVGCLHG